MSFPSAGRDYPKSVGEFQAWFRSDALFRFSRRQSRSRGMVFCRVLEFAVRHDAARYSDLIAGHRPRTVQPTPPTARGEPPSLERLPANRPWRKHSG